MLSTRLSRLFGICTMLARYNTSTQIGMSLHSVALSSLKANQSLFFLQFCNQFLYFIYMPCSKCFVCLPQTYINIKTINILSIWYRYANKQKSHVSKFIPTGLLIFMFKWYNQCIVWFLTLHDFSHVCDLHFIYYGLCLERSLWSL